MSLANKYRPQTFDAMIGQEHIIDILKAQMLSRETVHHNYLLFGPRGTGKTTTARLIAKGLNCLDLQNGNPCNHCTNCELINNATSLDYVEIDAASHTGVDNIREEIIDRALYPPTALKKKIYVIDEVHMLSKGAFNALLKTIEEPKNNVCFILATTELHKVPDTIISRCQVFNYRKVALHAMVNHLEHICQSENLTASRPALEIIANISEGHVRDAVKYIDQVSILGEINEANISKFLGVAGESTITAFLQSIKSRNRDQIFAQLDTINQWGIDLSQFAKQTIAYIDQHLLEDTDFFLSICGVFWEIISTLRRYPYPIIAYKIALNNYLNPPQKIESWPGNPVSSQGTTTTTQVVNVSPQVGVTSPVKNSEEEPEKIIETTPQSEVEKISTETPSEHQAPVSQEVSEMQTSPDIQITTSQSEKMPAPTTISESDFKTLWQNIIAQVSKPTLQANLKDTAIIEKKEGSLVHLTVITKIAEMLINNEENRKQIENLLSQALGEAIQIQMTYESKENYFARKMGI